MGLNAQPSGERVHIGFFGLRNAGKSSVVNRVTGQTLSIVSDVKGTTTDPVQKAMELLPIGPVVIIDTPGIDDEGTLGEERVRRALRVLEKTDIAVLVTDSTRGLQPAEQELIELFRRAGDSVCHRAQQGGFDFGSCRHAGKRGFTSAQQPTATSVNSRN